MPHPRANTDEDRERSPAPGAKPNVLPRVDDCDLFWEVHVPGILARARDTGIAGLTAVARFQLTGSGGGVWTVEVENGRIARAERGGSSQPTATITLCASDFAAIARGSLDHREAFFAGRIELEGDVGMVLWAANLIPCLRERFPFAPEERST